MSTHNYYTRNNINKAIELNKELEDLERMVYSCNKDIRINDDCTEPCIRTGFIGRSWWKRLGYHTDCNCCLRALNKKNKDKMSVIYDKNISILIKNFEFNKINDL